MPLYPSKLTTISYTEFTSNVTISGTSGAQTTVVTAPAFTADGLTTYWITFYSSFVQVGTSDVINVELWEGAALGEIGIWSASAPAYCPRRITPTSGSHTYSIRAWRSVNNGTIYGTAGGAGTNMPGFIWIAKAT